MTLSLADHVASHPDDVAVRDESGGITWRSLDQRANRLIDVLRRAGLNQGDRVAVHSGNRREVYEIAMACLHAGFHVLQTNWNYRPDELRFVLEDSDAKVLVVDDTYVEVARAALSGLAEPSLRFVMGAAASDGFESYENALAGASPEEPADQVAGAAMVYTSGTTGRPKGVFSAGLQPGAPLAALQGAAQGIRQGLRIPDDGRVLQVGPIYHSGQWSMSTFPLLCGIPVTMIRLPVPEQILSTVDRDRITNFLINPVDFVRLLKLSEEQRQAFDGSSLVQALHGGAPCAPDIKRRMIEWWGPIVSEYYGASEGGLFCLSTSEEWMAKPGSVGRVMPFLEMRIVADDGEPAETGEEGLIHFRHRNGADFSYHKQPEKTAEAHLEPGLFTLGDVGYADGDGYLYLSDRKTEVINSGGVKVYPAEIEGVLAAHPAVADVAVIGVPSEELGEEIKAAVMLEPSATASDELAAELIRYVAERLAPQKVPHSVDFFDDLPRTDAGKLAKAGIKARYWKDAGRRI